MIKLEISDPTLPEARAIVTLLVDLHGDRVLPKRAVEVNVDSALKVPEPLADTRDDEPRVPPPPPPPPTPAADAPRDAAGIAWDERIHTSNKATKQDGTWKRKPGLDDAFYDAVSAELAANAEPETVAAAPPSPPVEPEPVEAAHPTPPTATPAAEAFAAPVHTFVSNIKLINEKSVGKEAVDGVLAELGIAGLGALATADVAVQAEFAAKLGAM